MESYSIKNLTFSYPNQERKVLDDISLNINRGQFVVLCGASGCGKTTMLRMLKSSLKPHGFGNGSICYEGIPLDDLSQREQSQKIGFVLQNPDNQIVTDKVWHELAFGLESLGYDTPTIRLRVAEMASFFGIQNWFYKNVTELSGGQKQLLNLAAIMAMQPSVLILDEPTSQLDPIAASDFLATVGKINRELGTTILLTEHRLEDAMPLANRAIVMDDGKIIADGLPKDVGQKLSKVHHKMFLAMPVPMRIYASVPTDLECPITVKEGREWLDEFAKTHKFNDVEDIKNQTEINKISRGKPSVEVKEAWFKYERELPDVVKGVSISAYPGEFLAILGGNGTGKTTTLSIVSGILRPYRGQVMIFGKESTSINETDKFKGLLGVLPQNPQSLFIKKTVELDLYEMIKGRKFSNKEKKKKIKKVSSLCDLDNLMNQHPYDLSGGEQQRVALAKVLLLEPKILLMDEPTKGLDAEFKQVFASILRKLLSQKVTVIMVSHDIEFCAKYAHRCALFFDGGIVTEGTPKEFFSGNNFYTTAANRMARHLLTESVTAETVIKSCGGTVQPEIEVELNEVENKDEDLDDSSDDNNFDDCHENKNKVGFLNLKKFKALVSFIVFVIFARKLFPIISHSSWSWLISETNSNTLFSSREKWQYVSYIIICIISATTFCLSVFERSKCTPQNILQVDRDKRKLSKRTLASAVLILLLIPLTIFIGVFYLGDRKYYFISLLIIMETMIPFIMIFEGGKPQARELVVISVLCAIGVAGRAAFFMLPQFKPVAAMAIISGVAFGGESGFLIGTATMLISNMMFGQGPLTPWQMFAMGIIGFLAGVLFQKGLLRRDNISMAVFGGITVFFIYGGIMNPASAITFQSKITWPMIITYWVMGVPFDLIHAGATVFFLLIIGEPMLEKLDRIKVKYGLVDS